jgi:hypothetical protein
MLTPSAGAAADSLFLQTYHVVAAKALSSDLSDGQVLPTLNGNNLTVSLLHSRQRAPHNIVHHARSRPRQAHERHHMRALTPAHACLSHRSQSACRLCACRCAHLCRCPLARMAVLPSRACSLRPRS